MPPSSRLDEARAEKNRYKRRALEAEKQRDSLLKALREEVESRRAVARSMNAEPYWAGRTSPVADVVEVWADRLQAIIDQHEQGGGES